MFFVVSAWDLTQILYGPDKRTTQWDESKNQPLPEEQDEVNGKLSARCVHCDRLGYGKNENVNVQVVL